MQPDPDLALIFRYMGPIIGFVSVALAIMVPASIAYVRSRRNSGSLGRGPEMAMIEARLERIESAVDSIAIEVERISESQRFTARLQADVQKSAAKLPSGLNA